MSGPAEDRDAAVERLVEHALGSLDLPTRVALLTGGEYWRTQPVESIGLRAMVLSDGVAGVRGEGWSARDPSVCFPSPAALGATWDAELVGRLAELFAAEARRKGVDVVLAPTVNLQRTALAGRHFEYFAEDPLLTGRLGAAFVTSLQRHGVAATAKHYVANDAETHRFTVDVQVDEQTLHEVYLAPFEALVRAGAWLVMAAYNRVNGTTMSEHRLLEDPLVRAWGFDGVVVSDWYAARSAEPSARGGLTLVMPGPDGPWGAALLAAVMAGRVPESVIADKVHRLLRLAYRVGALGSTSAAFEPRAADDQAGGAALLREAAAAGAVLAANSGVLPLDRGVVQKLAVLGPHADAGLVQGGGSAEVVAEPSVSLLQALRSALGGTASIDHAVGASIRRSLCPVDDGVARCPSCGRPGVHVRYIDAGGAELRAEHRQDGRLIWFGHQLPPDASVEVSAQVRIDAAGRWQLGVAGVGHFRLEIDGEVVLDRMIRPVRSGFASSFLDPPEGSVTLDLAGDVELDVRLWHRPEHEVDFVKAVLGIRPPQLEAEEDLAAAVALATTADVAVVVVGTSDEFETEGRDRTALTLPGRQDELVHRVARANPRTVVVVISGAPVALPWRDEVAAVVLAPFAGQQQGPALADVLLGVAEPGGRLATTWAPDERYVASPRPVDTVLRYDEGLGVGYRGWLAAPATPAYWFGHGLGYTTWAYQGLAVPPLVEAGTTARVCARLANTGKRAGKEVVQAYLSRADSAVRRPPVWLAGWAVVHLEPGEVRDVEIELAPRAFQHWSTQDHAWRTESGAFRLTVGRSAGDRPLTAELVVRADLS